MNTIFLSACLLLFVFFLDGMDQKIVVPKKTMPVLKLAQLDPWKPEHEKTKQQKEAECQFLARCMVQFPNELSSFVAWHLFKNHPYIKSLVQRVPVKRDVFTGHTSKVFTLDFSPDNKLLASCSKDGYTILWDVQKHYSHDTSVEHLGKFISQVRFSPDGKRLVFGGDYNQLVTIDLQSNFVHTLPCTSSSIMSVAIDQKNSNVFIGEDKGSVYKVSLQSPTTKQMLYHAGIINYVAVNHDGSKLAIARNNGKIILFDYNQNKVLAEYQNVHGPESFWCVEFSPNDQLLAAVSHSGRLFVWDLTTHNEVLRKQAHPQRATMVTWFSNSRYCATISGGKKDAYSKTTIALWDVQKKERIRTISNKKLHKMWALALSPNQKYLACGGSDNNVSLYNIEDLMTFLDDLDKGRFTFAQTLFLIACANRGIAGNKKLRSYDDVLYIGSYEVNMHHTYHTFPKWLRNVLSVTCPGTMKKKSLSYSNKKAKYY